MNRWDDTNIDMRSAKPQPDYVGSIVTWLLVLAAAGVSALAVIGAAAIVTWIF